MQIDRSAIMQAKEKLGDKNAYLIVDELGITDFDEKNMRCCCPFHQEDHPSFIYNKKALTSGVLALVVAAMTFLMC